MGCAERGEVTPPTPEPKMRSTRASLSHTTTACGGQCCGSMVTLLPSSVMLMGAFPPVL